MSRPARRWKFFRCLGRTLLAAGLALGLPQFPAVAQAPETIPQETKSAPDGDVFGEEVTLTAKPMVFVAGKATWAKAFPTLTEKFKLIAVLLGKQPLKPAGPMTTIYTSLNDKGFEFQAAVTLAETPSNLPRGEIKAGQSPSGKALKFVYRGSYDQMEMLYESIVHYCEEKRIERQGMIVEEYVTDPLTTPGDKLVINVFVLVK
jgi:effector-binding domain-containing protein